MHGNPWPVGGDSVPVHGTVLDARSGDPMPFVAVAVVGDPSLSTYTDEHGRFQLEAPVGSVVSVAQLGFGAVALPVEEPGGPWVVDMVPSVEEPDVEVVASRWAGLVVAAVGAALVWAFGRGRRRGRR